MAEKLSWSLRWRLSALWMLQWGITGAILTYLPLYFTDKGLGSDQIGELMAVSAVGLWLAPFLVGQICDRWVGAEKYLAASHFCGGLLLLAIPVAADFHARQGQHFGLITILVGLYSVAYFPTVPVASALTFRHLPNPKAQFGMVRIWGTVGWVLAGLFLSIWLEHAEAIRWLGELHPEWRESLIRFGGMLEWLGPPSSDDAFRIAALLSFAVSSFCTYLPHSPPSPKSSGIAPLQVFAMFQNRSFGLMIGTSFILAILVPLYSLEAPKLLAQAGVNPNWVPAVMTVGQISEFPALLLLALCLKHLGMTKTFLLGMLAWLFRYLIFAVTSDLSTVLAGIAMHGICHVFLIIVIQLYVDAVCRPDLRASAQNLFAFVTMGIGMPIGFLFGGRLAEWAVDPETGLTSYGILFSIPATLIFLVILFYCHQVGIWPRRPARSIAHPSEADPETSPTPSKSEPA